MMGSLSRVLQPMSQTRRISVSALPQGQRSRSATLLGRRDRRLLWVVGSGWDLNAALIQECPEEVMPAAHQDPAPSAIARGSEQHPLRARLVFAESHLQQTGPADAASVIHFRRSLRDAKEMDGRMRLEKRLWQFPRTGPRGRRAQASGKSGPDASPRFRQKSEPTRFGRGAPQRPASRPAPPRWRQAPRQVCHRPRAFQRPEVPKTGLATPPPPWTAPLH